MWPFKKRISAQEQAEMDEIRSRYRIEIVEE